MSDNYRIIELDQEVAVVGKPTHAEQNENYNEHLGHFPHLLLGSPVRLPHDGGLPLEPPEGPAEVAVGAGEAEEGQDVGDQQVDDLVDVVHQGDVRLPVRPEQEAGGGGGDVVVVVRLGGGVEQGGHCQAGADTPDGHHGQREGQVGPCHVFGAGDCSVPARGV